MITKIIQELGNNNIIISSPFEDLYRAWEECQNPQKMLEIAKWVKIDRAIMVKIACKCVRLILHLVSEGENRPKLAIEAAEKWVENPSKENAIAAYAAANAAYTAYTAADAGNAASYAASYAATTAAHTIAYTAHAANTAYAAVYAAYHSGDTTIKKKCAEIVREYIPFELLKLAVIFN